MHRHSTAGKIVEQMVHSSYSCGGRKGRVEPAYATQAVYGVSGVYNVI